MGAALNVFCSTGKAGSLQAGFAAVDRSPASTPSLLPRRVLVVDDERDLADLAVALLGSCGLEVKVAYSGAEALEILASDREIDAVFSDVMMPGMTGLELADTVALLYPALKIVLASGFTAPALTEGRRAYLYAAKPYRIDTVLRLLRSYRS